MHRTIYDLLKTGAAQRPEAVAILGIGRPPLTYALLRDRVEAMVGRLRAVGVRRNDRVAILLPNGPEMATAFLGVASGATCAPLNPASRGAELDAYLSDVSARALVIGADLASPAREMAQRKGMPLIEVPSRPGVAAGAFDLSEGEGETVEFAQPEDVALVLPTSGTTSRPKIVPLTHVNLCSSAYNTMESLELGPSDRCLNVMPLFHIHGLIGATLSSLASGGSIACMPGLQPDRFFEWLRAFRPTWYTAVPTIHQAVLARFEADGLDLADCSLRFIRSCSASLPPRVAMALEQAFQVPVIEAYGMTEASHQVTSNPLPPRQRKPGSVGVAAGPEVAIMDEGGNLLEAGGIGEIVIRGANVTTGYDNNPTANESAFTSGWFRTGDLGTFDPDGYLAIIGRSKEIVNRGGEKIAPREVEEVLLDHPSVVQAVAFSVPHPTLGEDLAAAVVLREEAAVTEEELRRLAFDRLAGHKVPSQVVVVDEIPRGPTGKMQRVGLAAALKTELQPGYVPPRNPFEEAVAGIWAEELRHDRVGILDNFFALGGDSLAALSVLLQVERLCGQSLPLNTLFLAPTIEQLSSLLLDGRNAPRPYLVPLQPRGEKTPLFCVPGHGGDAFTFAGLARKLGPGQPLYAFRYPPEAEADDDIASAMREELGSLYLEEMRALQPRGPYQLAGHCFGAKVAFEMARQLVDRGQEVAFVGIIEAYLRGAEHPTLRDQARYHLRKLARLPLKQKVDYLGGRVRWRLRRTVGEVSMGCYPGRLTLFRAEYHDKCCRDHCRCDPRMGWGDLASEVVVYTIPGDKRSAYKEPHVLIFAEQLKRCLEGEVVRPR